MVTGDFILFGVAIASSVIFGIWGGILRTREKRWRDERGE
jgi:hypothetical protein